MVVDRVTDLTYTPLAEAGLSLMMISRKALTF
jgi:hypothetical protein